MLFDTVVYIISTAILYYTYVYLRFTVKRFMCLFVCFFFFLSIFIVLVYTRRKNVKCELFGFEYNTICVSFSSVNNISIRYSAPIFIYVEPFLKAFKVGELGWSFFDLRVVGFLIIGKIYGRNDFIIFRLFLLL